MSSPTRKSRRGAEQKSDDSGYGEDGSCEIERYLINQDPHRDVSASHPLIPWPFEEHAIIDKDLLQLKSHLTPTCKQICAKYQINCLNLKLSHLEPALGYKERDVLVAEVTNKKQMGVKSLWNEALTAIENVVNEYLQKNNLQRVLHVEIRNYKEMLQYQSCRILSNTPEHAVFTSVREKMTDFVRKNCEGWNVIGFRMRGQRYDDEKTRATLLISINPRTNNKWGELHRNCDLKLQELCKQVAGSSKHLSTYVDFVAGYAQPCVDSDDKDYAVPKSVNVVWKPQSGASIGPKDGDECGTLGPYVRATDKSGKIRKCAVTCYHCIRSGAASQEQLKSNDKYGIGLFGAIAGKKIEVSYPASPDAKVTREEGSANKDLIKILDHFESKPFGTVIHASGFGRQHKHKSRMDWALIELNDTTLFQPFRAVSKSLLTRYEQKYLTDKIYPSDTSSIDIKKVMEYPKVRKDLVETVLLKPDSRTTDARYGIISSVEDTVSWRDYFQKSTVEDHIEFGGMGGSCFVKFGDSGCAIHTSNFEMFGMAVGNIKQTDSSYATPFEWIIDDIKETTGLTITLA